MTDRRFIERAFPPRTFAVEKGRLQFFAKAIGETNPIYTDEAAAQASGYRSLPAPPTFTRCLETELYNAVEWLGEMGIDIGRVLHGERMDESWRAEFAGVRDVHMERMGKIQLPKRRAN